MDSPITLTLIAVALVSLVSLVGVLFLSLRSTNLKSLMVWFIGISVGALLGDALIHLIPEAFESLSDTTPYWILFGIGIFFIFEKFLHWHHHHEPHADNACTDCHEEHIKPFGTLIIFSDVVHNVIDGAIIAASFLISTEVGIATTIAVILHEIPQEIGDFGVLVHAGLSKIRALLFNFVSALSAFVGAGIVFAIGNLDGNTIPIASAITAGGFLYIAMTDLVPELHKSARIRDAAVQLFAIGVGIALMFALTFAEAEHTQPEQHIAYAPEQAEEVFGETVDTQQTYSTEITAYASRIIDGDTIAVDIGNFEEIVRLIGIDAPERNINSTKGPECYAREATELLATLVHTGDAVRLVKDESQSTRDQYGRLLAYVFVGDTNINLALIQEGAAREYTFKGVPYTYQTDFQKAESLAQTQPLGLWAVCK